MKSAQIKRLCSYLKPYLPQVALLWVGIIAAAVIGLVPSIATGKIVDEAFVGKNMGFLLQLLAVAFVAVLVNEILDAITGYASTWISSRVVVDMRNGLFTHLQRMPQAFFSTEKQGDIITRMNADTTNIGSMINSAISNAVDYTATIVATLVTLFSLSWQLALVGLIVLPLLVLPTRRAGQDRLKYAQQTQAKTDEMNQSINETLSSNGALLVKMFTREDDECERFTKVSNEQTRFYMKETRTGSLFSVTTRTLADLGPLFIYFAGGLLIIQTLDPDLTVGTVTAMVALVAKLYSPVVNFLNLQVTFTRTMALVDRVFDYLDRKSTITSPENAQKPDMECASVRFDHVAFGYDEDLNVLEDVHFEVPGGKMYALVGTSGVGKTTALNLIPRLYDTGKGTVSIAGVDVRDFDLSYLRQQVGVVTQEAYLFGGTIRSNLLYAKRDATPDEMEAACKLAGIHDYIMRQPDGYDFEVGNGGSKLSGGERQRLSLARVILKDPKILILDEATSALDSISEHAIQQALETLMVGRTTIVAAHRLATILKADRILVLNDGVIVEEGTHEDLLENGSLYRELYETQFDLVVGMEGKRAPFDIQSLGTNFTVRRIAMDELPNVHHLLSGHRKHRQALNLRESAFDLAKGFGVLTRGKQTVSIAKDLDALVHDAPMDMSVQDAHFVGFYDKTGNLVAVLDLVFNYPEEEDAFIAWFMVDASAEGRGIGSSILSDVRASMAAQGFKHLRLKYPNTDEDTIGFWKKQGFQVDGPEDRGLIDMSLDL